MRKLLCNLCGIETISKGRQIYCGSYKKKTGCSYEKHKERRRKSYLIWKKNHPEDWKRTEEYRKKVGYYEKIEVKNHRKVTSRKRYMKKISTK